MNNMAEKKNLPEIRFKGFTEEWAENELFQLADVHSGRDYKHLSNGDIPVYGTGGYMLSVNEALSYKADAIGIGRKGTIDKPYILKAPFWTVDTLFYAIPKGKNILNFIYDIFQKINWKQKDESTGVPSLSKVAINGIHVFIPKYTEQIGIGTYFKHLDHLITLHQSKYDKLVNVKKAMLEKMFPKKGDDVPEIRFKGFTGAWKEKKLGKEVEIISTGKSHFVSNTEKSDNAPYAILGSTSIIGYDSNFDYSGDFILTARVGANAGDLYKYSGYVKISDNTVFIQSKNLDFIFFLLTKFNLKSLSFGTGQPLIKASELSNLKLMFSFNKEEQQKIGTFFKHLDHLLSLQQQELEKLKNIKKACLEKMFV